MRVFGDTGGAGLDTKGVNLSLALSNVVPQLY
jgi:hypothetical protein